MMLNMKIKSNFVSIVAFLFLFMSLNFNNLKANAHGSVEAEDRESLKVDLSELNRNKLNNNLDIGFKPRGMMFNPFEDLMNLMMNDIRAFENKVEDDNSDEEHDVNNNKLAMMNDKRRGLNSK